MKIKMLVAVFVCWTLGGVTAKANADSFIVLTSSSGGVYDYSIETTTTETFNSNSTIVLSGLSGVTAISVSGELFGCFFPFHFDSTSVTFSPEIPNANHTCVLPVLRLGTLEIVSSVLTLGTVNYSVNSTTPSSGTVQGPVADATSTPEPSSLLLLGTGLIGGIGVLRRKFIK